MKRILLTAVALALLVASPALAKTPPSFARWNDAYAAKQKVTVKKMTTDCLRIAGQSDTLKFGECYVAGMYRLSLANAKVWDLALTRIQLPQPLPCRTAITAYRLAAHAMGDAGRIYFMTHPRTDIRQVIRDLSGEPYATLTYRSDLALVRAGRICG